MLFLLSFIMFYQFLCKIKGKKEVYLCFERHFFIIIKLYPFHIVNVHFYPVLNKNQQIFKSTFVVWTNNWIETLFERVWALMSFTLTSKLLWDDNIDAIGQLATKISIQNKKLELKCKILRRLTRNTDKCAQIEFDNDWCVVAKLRPWPKQ